MFIYEILSIDIPIESEISVDHGEEIMSWYFREALGLSSHRPITIYMTVDLSISKADKTSRLKGRPSYIRLSLVST